MNQKEQSLLKSIIKLQISGIKNLDIQTMKQLYSPLSYSESDLIDGLNRHVRSNDFGYLNRIKTKSIVNNALEKYEQSILDELEHSAFSYNSLGSDIAREEINGMNKVTGVGGKKLTNNEVQLPESKELLLNRSKSKISSYVANIRSNVDDALVQMEMQKASSGKVKGNISQYMNIKKNRLKLILRTELSKVLNGQKLLVYIKMKNKYFPDMMKRLFHPIDNRTGDDSLQLKELDPLVPLDQPFKFTYKYRLKNGTVRSVKRVFFHPPDRVNDRAQLVSFRKSWDDE